MIAKCRVAIIAAFIACLLCSHGAWATQDEDSTSDKLTRGFYSKTYGIAADVKGAAPSCSVTFSGNSSTTAPFGRVVIVKRKRDWRWGDRYCYLSGTTLYVYCGRSTSTPMITATPSVVTSGFSIRGQSAWVQPVSSNVYHVHGFYCIAVGPCFGSGAAVSGSAGNRMSINVKVECIP